MVIYVTRGGGNIESGCVKSLLASTDRQIIAIVSYSFKCMSTTNRDGNVEFVVMKLSTVLP